MSWGAYAPAIERWERVTGRRAPAPTEPGRDGRPRLSPKFTEWMMGLPEGHVTAPEIGLTRAQMLKACGNGVVPQQAAMALSLLLGLPWGEVALGGALLPTATASMTTGAGSSGRDGGLNLQTAVSLLPTPVASVSEPAEWKPGVMWWLQSRAARNLEAIVTGNTPLLPTPAVNDMGEGKSISDWDAWTERMKAAHRNGNGHGRSLAIEAARLAPVEDGQLALF